MYDILIRISEYLKQWNKNNNNNTYMHYIYVEIEYTQT